MSWQVGWRSQLMDGQPTRRAKQCTWHPAFKNPSYYYQYGNPISRIAGWYAPPGNDYY